MRQNMKKSKPVITRSAAELARAIGLSQADALNMEIRRKINQKIIEAVARSGLTHVEAARLAQTSRSRLTALLNRNTGGISTDLMLKILVALGYRATITFSRNRSAA
jgi:predicted XRE-type DNA-binding protein